MNKSVKFVKSSDLTKFWVAHRDYEKEQELSEKFLSNKISAKEYNVEMNKVNYSEEIEYDHSETLLEQLNEIIADPTVVVVSVKDNTSNPNLDGANTLLRWEDGLHTRKLTSRGLMGLMDASYIARPTTFTEEAK